MHIGQAIKTFSHAQAWCLDQKQRVVIKSKKGNTKGEHSFKVIKNMPFGTLGKMMNEGRLFELHK